MNTSEDPNPIDTYIATFPEHVQKELMKIRSIIRELLPDATETISYGIPTFDLNGKHVIHFAGFKKHVSLFPTASGVEAFKDQLSHYKISKGTIQFPLDAQIPYDLIREITLFRKKEVLGK